MKIGEFARQKIAEGLDNEAVLEAVKAQFPNAKTTLNCIRWYRGKMDKPTAPKPPAKKAKKVEKSNKPTIELRSIKLHVGLSEETPAYTAKLLVDGMHFADVSNDGHGGPDYVYPPKGKYAAPGQQSVFQEILKELDLRIGTTYPSEECHGMTLTPCLEMICHGLVWEDADLKRFKGQLSRGVLTVEGGKVYAYKLKGRNKDAIISGIKINKPEAIVLNDLTLEAAWDMAKNAM